MTNTEVAVPAALMRGGTSKGLFFVAGDLPRDTAARDRFLLAAMGSPDVREIDGVLRLRRLGFLLRAALARAGGRAVQPERWHRPSRVSSTCGS